MKKLFVLTFAILFAGVLGIFAQDPSYYERTSIQPIMVQAATEVMSAESDLGLEIVNLQFDLLIGTGWKYSYRTLSSDWAYVVYAAGQNGEIRDLDLKVARLGPNGEFIEVASDESTDLDGTVVVVPPTTGTYVFGVRVPEYADGYFTTHYYILIAHAKPK